MPMRRGKVNTSAEAASPGAGGDPDWMSSACPVQLCHQQHVTVKREVENGTKGQAELFIYLETNNKAQKAKTTVY